MDLDQISQSWRMICSSPLRHAGQELMELQDKDLMCPLLGHGQVEHFDEVAEEGSQILLPCGSKNQGTLTLLKDVDLRYYFKCCKCEYGSAMCGLLTFCELKKKF